MIPSDFFDAVVTEFVQACVANMTNRNSTVTNDSDCQHAGHAVPFRTRPCSPVNLVVRICNCFADSLGNGLGLPFKPLSKSGQRDVGRFSTSGLAAHAVDHDEQAAGRVTIESVFVHVALPAGVGLTGGYQCMDGSHLIEILSCCPNVTRYDRGEAGQQKKS
jgi:hypothetical protein